MNSLPCHRRKLKQISGYLECLNDNFVAHIFFTVCCLMVSFSVLNDISYADEQNVDRAIVGVCVDVYSTGRTCLDNH